MRLKRLEVQGYRSLQKVNLPLGQLNVITGPNGSGKSNLYKSLWLIARIARGDFAQTIAHEGGMLSTMWAGPRTSKKPWRMKLGFQLEDYHFELSSGFPIPDTSPFPYEAEIKEESIWIGKKKIPSMTILERGHGYTWVRDAAGKKVEYVLSLIENESIVSQLTEPERFPELSMIKTAMLNWRFYHQFRTDEASPIRSPQTGVKSSVLNHDGSNLAAAILTIDAYGDGHRFTEILERAFPNRRVSVMANVENPYEKMPGCQEYAVTMEVEGCARPLMARELSDGTLKFLCLAAALMSPRPPALIALNEPEGSLHDDLLPALAELILEASKYSQVWVTTHSQTLRDLICQQGGVKPIELSLVEGATRIVDHDLQDDFDE